MVEFQSRWNALGAALTLALGAGAMDAHAAPIAGTVLQGRALVVDGDTIEISGQRIRLEGIDAPESTQTCAAPKGGTWPCGKAATRALYDLISTEAIECESTGTDKYGRMLGLCFLDGEDINGYMVEAGFAWAFVKYSTRYAGLEDRAKAAKSGIWQAPSQPAWEYRASGWQVAGGKAPAGCPIKGNVSRSGRIYHMPWSPWYGKVTVEEGRGERWFCTEAEAQAAGWRPAAPN